MVNTEKMETQQSIKMEIQKWIKIWGSKNRPPLKFGEDPHKKSRYQNREIPTHKKNIRDIKIGTPPQKSRPRILRVKRDLTQTYFENRSNNIYIKVCI